MPNSDPDAPPSPEPSSPRVAEADLAPARPAPVSLMITRRQKDRLRALGFAEEAIREMTPADAHARLGV